MTAMPRPRFHFSLIAGCGLCLGLLLFLFAVPKVQAQTLRITYDPVFPTGDYQDDQHAVNLDKSRQYGFTLAAYSTRDKTDAGALRFGVCYRRKSLRTLADQPGATLHGFSANAWQFGVDRTLKKWGDAKLSLGLTLGFTGINCRYDLPGDARCTDNWIFDRVVRTFTPELTATIPIARRYDLFLGARRDFYGNPDEGTYLFESGYVYSIGLVLN
jgi:hypothetical protein